MPTPSAVPKIVVVLAVALVTIVVLAVPAEAQPSIKIQIKKNAPSCQSPGDCEIYVRDRGVGVCESPRQDTGGVYCHGELEWDLIGKGQLSSKHLVLIVWSPQSTSGSAHCLNQQTYVLTTSSPSAKATVQADPQCSGKMTWLYDVVLLYDGLEIDRDDPGVLIED